MSPVEAEDGSRAGLRSASRKRSPWTRAEPSTGRKGKRRRRRRKTPSTLKDRSDRSPSAAADGASSSACSSPLRAPYIPLVVIGYDSDGGEIHKPFEAEELAALAPLEAKYHDKRVRQMKLPTLHQSIPSTCLVDPKFLSVRKSATKTVLGAAKFVVGLSSSIGGKVLGKTAGFIVDWDKESQTGIIMTSAHLICLKSPSIDDWNGEKQYASNAEDLEIIVHFVGGTTVKGNLLYCQKHYDIVFIGVEGDVPAHLPSFTTKVELSDDVFILGRDEFSNLRISYGVVQYLNAHLIERQHFVYIHSPDDTAKIDNGGPVIDCNGKVVGLSIRSTRGSFIPSSIILKCFQLWQKFKCIPRPHLCLKLWAIEFLDPAHVEKIMWKCNIDEGLIVMEMSGGSVAERLGVRVGDVITCFNGESITSTVELENLLLRIVEEHLDKGNGCGSKMNVEIGVFHTRKCVRSNVVLTVDVSDGGEVVVIDFPVICPLPSGENISAQVQLGQADTGSFYDPTSTGEDSHLTHSTKDELGVITR